MNEIEKAVGVVQVWMLCRCGGTLKATGHGVHRGYNTLYEHQCDKCFVEEMLSHSYPRVKYIPREEAPHDGE